MLIKERGWSFDPCWLKTKHLKEKHLVHVQDQELTDAMLNKAIKVDFRIDWGERNQLNQQIQTQAQNLFSWTNTFPQYNSSKPWILHVHILGVSSGSWGQQIRIHMICIGNKTCKPWLYA